MLAIFKCFVFAKPPVWRGLVDPTKISIKKFSTFGLGCQALISGKCSPRPNKIALNKTTGLTETSLRLNKNWLLITHAQYRLHSCDLHRTDEFKMAFFSKTEQKPCGLLIFSFVPKPATEPSLMVEVSNPTIHIRLQIRICTCKQPVFEI